MPRFFMFILFLKHTKMNLRPHRHVRFLPNETLSLGGALMLLSPLVEKVT